MRATLRKLWADLGTSYLVVPGLLSAGGLLLAWGVTTLDAHVAAEDLGWLRSYRADGAREILSTVAGSAITVAGVVFSITVAVLAFASNQFGPRLLVGFLRQRTNQVTLGVFLGTYLFCLVALRSVQGGAAPAAGDGDPSVPQLGVTVALALAVLDVAVLVTFIHRLTVSVQASSVIATIGEELDRAVTDLLSRGASDLRAPPPDDAASTRLGRDAPVVTAERAGYVQGVDLDGLAELARREGLELCVLVGPGSFVGPHVPLVASTGDRPLAPDVCRRVRRHFATGTRRMPDEDVLLVLHELVEVAARALSSGVNDPFTAITCLDWLGNALIRLAAGASPPARHEADPRVQVDHAHVDLARLATVALDALRPYVAHDTNAARHTFSVLGRVAGAVTDDAGRHVVRSQADALLDACATVPRALRDRVRLEDAHRGVLDVVAR